MQFKADGLLLRAVDYGENDKIVTLFTAERGKLTASMKGVKKAGAKLRFAAQPFCFAEYVFSERGGRNTVTGASLYDGFYALREDVGAYYAAVAVCEGCDKLLFEGMESPALFLAAVNALKEMCSGSPAPALLRFFCKALTAAGYPVRAEACPVCGGVPAGRMRFDMEEGTFLCAECGEGVPASESTYRALQAAGRGGEGSEDGTVRALRLVRAYFLRKTGEELSALAQFLAL